MNINFNYAINGIFIRYKKNFNLCRFKGDTKIFKLNFNNVYLFYNAAINKNNLLIYLHI